MKFEYNFINEFFNSNALSTLNISTPVVSIARGVRAYSMRGFVPNVQQNRYDLQENNQ